MNEWEFTAEVASRINTLIERNPEWPLSRAAVEQAGKGGRARRDLTLLDKSGRVVLTGEIKLPYRPDGGTPFNANVVKGARSKALQAQCEYFFTWNVNEFVLWETRGAKVSWQDDNYRSWEVTNVLQESHLESPPTWHGIDIWLYAFLRDFGEILRGVRKIGVKLPDEKFIDALESALRIPVRQLQEELENRYAQPRFKSEIDKWMRDEQGWTISDDPEGIRENLENAAKAACYSLVNRLVFHEALLKRFSDKMRCLDVPKHVDTGEGLRLELDKFFEKAKNVTGDYETVFGEDPGSIGNRIPFYADQSVPHWRELIQQIHRFDFSKLDYEVIGAIFERLIEPERRRKFGQFYTRVEVVDFINSFCIRRGDEKVMDPACGGGTFLVRAYSRKREILPARTHSDRLDDLYGIDVADFPARLTTINLAVRDLVGEENYPQVARADFFDVRPKHPFLILPRKVSSQGLGPSDVRAIEIPDLDSVVGNPPYIRQESIRKGKRIENGTPMPGTKEFYRKRAREEGNVDLSGRSDIHCYFWPHAAAFLKKDGYLCFLTSSQWLDVEYGFRLQEWILRNFRIVAVLESVDEPWFVGARVATAITILQREDNERVRMDHVVRFVQIRRPVAELLAHDGTAADAMRAANELRDEILNLTKDTSNVRYRARLVRQGGLWDEGVRIGRTMARVKAAATIDDENGEEEEHDEAPKQGNGYFGGKWGVYLRAPDLWFRLLDEFRDRLVPLGEIADIRRGITSGKDEFFFPKDCSVECLKEFGNRIDFEDQFGVPRKDVSSGKVKLVRCGEGRGEIRPIESEYLEPEVHSLMEVKGFTVRPEDCSRMILLVGKKKPQLKGTYVLHYIKWGEKKGLHESSTCRNRVTAERDWYDLTGHERGVLFWPMAQQYKHAIPLNRENLICNHNLFDLSPASASPEILAAVLNSTWTVLSKFQYGRPVGVEGNLKTEVIDVKMMLVPDPTKCRPGVAEHLSAALRRLEKREALQFLSERRMREMAYTQAKRRKELMELPDVCELDMADRRELDDAVLEMLGVTSKKRRRELIGELYAYLQEFFVRTRLKEERAIANKRIAKKRGSTSPTDVAEQIYKEVEENEPRLLRPYDPGFLDPAKPYDTFEVPLEGFAEPVCDLLTQHGVAFRKSKKDPGTTVATRFAFQDNLLAFVANSGATSPKGPDIGYISVPHNEQECLAVYREYERFLRNRNTRLRELVAERTADEDVREKVFEALVARVNRIESPREVYPLLGKDRSVRPASRLRRNA